MARRAAAPSVQDHLVATCVPAALFISASAQRARRGHVARERAVRPQGSRRGLLFSSSVAAVVTRRWGRQWVQS